MGLGLLHVVEPPLRLQLLATALLVGCLRPALLEDERLQLTHLLSRLGLGIGLGLGLGLGLGSGLAHLLQ